MLVTVLTDERAAGLTPWRPRRRDRPSPLRSTPRSVPVNRRPVPGEEPGAGGSQRGPGRRPPRTYSRDRTVVGPVPAGVRLHRHGPTGRRADGRAGGVPPGDRPAVRSGRPGTVGR